MKPIPLTFRNDPWDPIHSLKKHGRHVLTSVEFTMTQLCNMRCEHCAVGETLAAAEGERIPLKTVLQRLDEMEHLETISITGGEPAYSPQTVTNYIVPLLKYARERGIQSQLNSNATLNYSRYEEMAPFLDVLHISFNYLNAGDFHEIGFSRSACPVGKETAQKLFGQMVENTTRLSREGLFISAESMINYRTYGKLDRIHRLIAEMGCRRHEVHPMYPSSFAAELPILGKEQFMEEIERLLAGRHPDVWILFGTLPFFQCSNSSRERQLLETLRNEPNLSVRNDPDGRNRLNVNLFTGELFVTDFADLPALGNVKNDRLDQVFEQWTSHPLYHKVNCYCPSAGCCGPNLLVADMYYRNEDFHKKQAVWS